MDIAKIEQLVSMYIELDEEDQKSIFDETAVLFFSKSTKNQVVENNYHLPTKKQLKGRELEGKIAEKVCQKVKRIEDIMILCDKLPPEGKAAMMMLAHTLGNKSSNVTEPKVKVTISYHSKSMKDIVEESLPGVNYENAYRMYQEMLAEARKEMIP